MTRILSVKGPVPTASVLAAIEHLYADSGRSVSYTSLVLFAPVNTSSSSPVLIATSLMTYSAMSPLWSSAGGGAQENVTEVGSTDSLTKFSGGLVGTMERDIYA